LHPLSSRKKKGFLVLYFDVRGIESGAIFDFPKDIGDRRKTEMMQEIMKAKLRIRSNTYNTNAI